METNESGVAAFCTWVKLMWLMSGDRKAAAVRLSETCGMQSEMFTKGGPGLKRVGRSTGAP